MFAGRAAVVGGAARRLTAERASAVARSGISVAPSLRVAGQTGTAPWLGAAASRAVGEPLTWAARCLSTRVLLSAQPLGRLSWGAVPLHMRVGSQVGRPLRAGALRRLLSTTEKEAAETAAASEAGAQPRNPENLPMIATVGRGAKTGGKFALFLGISGLVLGAGYYIIRELFPRQMSPNAVFNRASDVVTSNPDVVHKLGGDVKTFGTDFGSRREGRRFNIPEYRYEGDDGQKYMRVVFNAEGPHGRKAKVFAEVADDMSSDKFSYLIVQVDTGEIITIQDNRKPVKPRSMRQSDVCMALMSLRAVVYGKDMESATVNQKNELGTAFSNLKYVRCDLDPAMCTDAGVETTPAIHVGGKKLEGFQSLETLEKTVKSLGAKL